MNLRPRQVASRWLPHTYTARPSPSNGHTNPNLLPKTPHHHIPQDTGPVLVTALTATEKGKSSAHVSSLSPLLLSSRFRGVESVCLELGLELGVDSVALLLLHEALHPLQIGARGRFHLRRRLFDRIAEHVSRLNLCGEEVRVRLRGGSAAKGRRRSRCLGVSHLGGCADEIGV